MTFVDVNRPFVGTELCVARARALGRAQDSYKGNLMRNLTPRCAIIALAAASLSACASVPAETTVAAAPAPAADAVTPLRSDVVTELPRVATPRHYSIIVNPDMDAMAFTGNVAIDLTVFEPTQAITLNANNLTFSSAKLVAADGSTIALTPGSIADNLTVPFNAAQTIEPGDYRMEIAYAGEINTQASGLFALDYPDKRTGEDVRALFTQFEAPDARRFVPSFDEPSYKATFDLAAVVPADLMAVSNMPVVSSEEQGDGTKLVRFDTTPKMSSYLLYFGLGDFERMAMKASDGTEVGIVSPAGSGEQARFALEGLAQIVPYYNDYFGVDYPLPKLDNIAGPGSSQFFSAMENWGAIFTFERLLLDDPKITSAATRRAIYDVQSHETAHQWFGDLVTMGWWDDLWLNEGFASWMQTKSTDHFHPEWDQLMQRIGGREAAMGMDAFATTHPIVQEIEDVSAVEQAFDAIAYQKGEAVISMLEAYAGEDTWRDGLRIYMKKHAYSNTKSADLWLAIEQAGGTGVSEVAYDFTTKPGVPLVTVTGATCEGGNTTISLKQGEFSLDRKDEVTADPQSWRVPLLLRTGADGGMRELLEGTASYTVPGCGAVVVNGGQLGYFRTLYTPEMLDKIIAAFPTLAPMDQYGLMRDNLALSFAGYQPMGEGLDVLAAVPTSAEGVLAESTTNRLYEFYEFLEDDAAKAKLAAYATKHWQPRLMELGFEAKADDSVVNAELRDSLIRNLGAMGDPSVLAEADRLAAALANDPTALDGPLKQTWLAVIARNADADQWDMLRRLANETTSAVESDSYFTALGAAKDEALAKRALELALTDEPSKTVAANIISVAVSGHPEMGYAFVKANRDAVAELVDPSGRNAYLARQAAKGAPEQAIAQLEELRANVPASDHGVIDKAIAQEKYSLANTARQREGLSAWVDTL